MQINFLRPFLGVILWISASATVVIAQTTSSPVLQKFTSEEHAAQITDFQKEINIEYRDPAHSPLPAAARKKFVTLPFYPIDISYCVEAVFVRDSTSAAFLMPTSKPREAHYRRYGELRFTLDGQSLHLSVYQNLDLITKPEYKNYLFVPFTDLTNGHETYGGGRYLDLVGPLGKVVRLDFNRAYNPYCAYSDRFSCPIPPAENRLHVPIRAGVQSDH